MERKTDTVLHRIAFVVLLCLALGTCERIGHWNWTPHCMTDKLACPQLYQAIGRDSDGNIRFLMIREFSPFLERHPDLSKDPPWSKYVLINRLEDLRNYDFDLSKEECDTATREFKTRIDPNQDCTCEIFADKHDTQKRTIRLTYVVGDDSYRYEYDVMGKRITEFRYGDLSRSSMLRSMMFGGFVFFGGQFLYWVSYFTLLTAKRIRHRIAYYRKMDSEA